MAVVRKVQSKLPVPAAVTSAPAAVEKKAPYSEANRSRSAGGERREGSSRLSADGKVIKRKCHFCKTKTEPRYWDAVTLRRCLSDRGRIYPRSRSGACAKHQRRVSRNVKYARHLALLPFTVSA